MRKENRIQSVSAEVKNAILRSSAYSLPDRPSERGMKPAEIKKAFYQPITDSARSVLAEIDRVVNEANEIIEQQQATVSQYAELASLSERAAREDAQRASDYAREAEESAKALKNPSMEVVKEDGVATVTFTDAVGNRSTLEILDGKQGADGGPFTVSAIYSSIEEMEAGYAQDAVAIGGFVILETGSEQNGKNAKLYVKGERQYVFVSDLSGFQGLSAFVRYSSFPDGREFSERWDWSRKYVGFATAHTAPTEPEDYQWVAIGDDTFVVVDGGLMLKCDETALNNGGVFIIEASFDLNDCMMDITISDENGQRVWYKEWNDGDGLQPYTSFIGTAEVALEPGVYSISTYMCSIVSICKKADLEIRQSSGASESSVMSQRAVSNSFSNALKKKKIGKTVTLEDISPIDHALSVTVQSKNLFDPSFYPTHTYNGVSIQYLPEEDCFLLNGTATDTISNLQFIEPFGEQGAAYTLSTYYLSGSIVFPESGGSATAFFGENDIPNNRTNWLNVGRMKEYDLHQTAILNCRYVTSFWFYITKGIVLDNYKVRVQLEKANAFTEWSPFVSDVSGVTVCQYRSSLENPIASAETDVDGVIKSMASAYPVTILTTDREGVVIECEYNRDINQALDALTQAILSLGGIL